MASFSSLIEILNAIEERLNGVLSVSKDSLKFNDSIKSIKELENLLKILNDFIVNNNNEKDFSQEEKELMKKVLNSIIELEKINKNKLGFFDSLNNYFYDSINK
tara:strand:- start:353 stop:664 length:312 start_codon:yes stop_codon:yes gene_type:complete